MDYNDYKDYPYPWIPWNQYKQLIESGELDHINKHNQMVQEMNKSKRVVFTPTPYESVNISIYLAACLTGLPIMLGLPKNRNKAVSFKPSEPTKPED